MGSTIGLIPFLTPQVDERLRVVVLLNYFIRTFARLRVPHSSRALLTEASRRHRLRHSTDVQSAQLS